MAGQVPTPSGNFALTSTRPYVKAYFEFSLADVYSFVWPWNRTDQDGLTHHGVLFYSEG